MSASDSGLYENTNSSTSTLRPRNARLISYLEDQSEPAVAATTTSAASSKASSLFASHSDSPNQGLGRARSLNKSQNTNEITSHPRSTSLSEPSGDIWSSWSSIASSFLGSDTHSAHKGKNKPPSRPPKWMKQDRAYHSHPLSPHWGPKTGPSTMVSSPDDRQALVQAKKREAMLSSSTGVKPDATGHHKRRDSDAHLVYNESEEEVLVYKHQVKNDETLPGVILRYGCQQDVFRKANGLWYNNSFQMRKHVYVPVEACSIRGKKVGGPAPVDLTSTKVQSRSDPDSLTQADGHSKVASTHEADFTSDSADTSLDNTSTSDTDIKHDSWVELPSFPDPVEVLRMPRNALGFFPRAKRKQDSSYHDISTISTPRSSFDTLRHPLSHAAQMSASLNASPVRRPMHLRQRSSSTTVTQSAFVEALQGPGGVGPLRGLRTEPSRPGPQPDVLNREFARRFPNFKLEPEQPPSFLSIPERLTPRASTDSVRSTRSNSSGLGEVGGRVEGWVRKMAGVNTKSAKTNNMGRMGDLIELETNSDFGDALEEIEEDDLATPTLSSMAGDGAGLRSRGSAIATEDEELLNERFPVRGRVRNAYDTGKDRGV